MILITTALFLGVQGGEPVKSAAAKEMIARLQHKEVKVRLQAIQNAATHGAKMEPHVVRAVVGCLDDGDARVRRAALQLVGDLGPLAREWGGGPKLGDVLARLSQEKDVATRRAAVWAYGQVGIDREEELKTLYAALKDKAPEIRGTAMQSLGQYLHEDTPKEWRLAAEEEIAALLKDTDQRVARVAAEQLLAAGTETVPTLLKVIETSKGGTARLWAALVLGELGEPAREAVPALQKLLMEVPADRRPIIQQALRKIQP